jgi:thiol-disulfide isomerase/thioredoxin
MRGTLIGMPMPRIDFLWSHRPSDEDVRARFASTDDFHGQPTLLVGTLMAALFDGAPDHWRDGIEQIQAVAERFRGQPFEIVVLVQPWQHPLATGFGHMMDPPEDMLQALTNSAETGGYDFVIALAANVNHPDLGRHPWPILLDHELNLVETNVRLRDIDDLTERVNELLIDASLVAEDDPSLPRLERKAAVGEPAPELDFEWTSDGLEASSLRDLRGRIVVLDFWATWCGPCIASFPHLREIREHYDENEVVIIGVTSLQGTHVTPDRERIDTSDDPQHEYELMIEFMDLKDMTWEVAFTKQNVFNQAYGVRGIPSVFVIDQKGVLQSRRLHPMAGETRIRSLINGLLAERSN